MGEELTGNLLEYNVSAMIVAMLSMAVVSEKQGLFFCTLTI